MKNHKNAIIHRLRKIGFKKRMFIGFSIVSVLPVTILFLSVSTVFYLNAVKNHHQQAIQTAGEMQYRIALLTEKKTQALNEFASDLDIVKSVRKLELSQDPVECALLESNLRIRLLSNVSKGSSQIRAEILNRDGQPITGIFDEYYSDLADEARDNAVNSSQRLQLWSGISYQRSEEGAVILVFSREIINFFNGSRIGWVLVYETIHELEQTLGQIHTDETMAVYEKNGNAIYVSGPLREHILNEFSLTDRTNPDSQWTTIRKEKALLHYDEVTGWSEVIFPDPSEINHILKTLLLCAAIIYLPMIAVILYLSFLITRTVTEPLDLIREGMKNFSAGNLNSRVIDDGEDELAGLAREFNHMSTSIEHLTSEVCQAQAKEKEAVLHALEAQINPHFLYNTLDMVNWMSYRSSNKDACKVIKCLSDFFRLSLNQGRDIYTLADEVRHVECYITIEKYKKTHVNFVMNADPDLLDCVCPKLIVQPLVENALIHGLEPKRYEGTVEIDFRKHDGKIRITVTDDGVGLSNTARENAVYHGSSYGLENINERLKMLYDDSCRVELLERQEGGVTATIYLPLCIPKEEYHASDDRGR